MMLSCLFRVVTAMSTCEGKPTLIIGYSQADARVPELFVLLHGTLFTNIWFDDFSPTLAHFLERTKVKGAEECEWIVVAVANVGAILEVAQPSEWHVAQGWYCTSSPQCALIHLNEPASSACAVASTGNLNLLSSLHTLKICATYI
jgi:hypothetical protein